MHSGAVYNLHMALSSVDQCTVLLKIYHRTVRSNCFWPTCHFTKMWQLAGYGHQNDV